MENKIMETFVLVLLLAGFASAATGAALQVTGHTVVPSTIYPGTTGQLQVTVDNSGTDTAGGVSVYYTTPTASSTVYAGDIAQGATATVSIPFSVPSDYGSGIMTIYLNIYYDASSTAGSSNSKNTPVTIPLEISQHQSLTVNTVSVSPVAVTPGDTFRARLLLVNTGGTTNNIIISSADNSSFTLSGTTQQSVGSISAGANRTVEVAIDTSSSTASGKYSVPLTVSYQDSLQNTLTQTTYVGPETVYDSSAQFKVTLVPTSPVEVGSETAFDLTLENLGGSSSPAYVDINSSSVFTPIGSTRVFFDPIAPGEKSTQKVTIGVGATTTAGYYSLPLTINGNGKGYTQNIGITVDATPELTATADTSPSTGAVTVTIANIGNSAIRSVYVSTASTKELRVSGTTDKFIGTLNVDDFATVSETVSLQQGVSPGKYSLPINITFKDTTNARHTLIKNVDVQASAASPAGSATATGTAGFSGRNRSTGLFGLGDLPLYAGALLLIVLAFFGYKRWKGEKVDIKIPFIGAKKADEKRK
ncbi:NPCBM-associated, NEW3 domain of alpha-galactosidase [uncultured archaeon]|nr:NPCBM-associated, NEW3 domain of alpha-galactosidase [uncultured archaeon]